MLDGTPEISPPALSVRPGGRDPLVTAKVSLVWMLLVKLAV
jgi:hypothetical protein